MNCRAAACTRRAAKVVRGDRRDIRGRPSNGRSLVLTSGSIASTPPRGDAARADRIDNGKGGDRLASAVLEDLKVFFGGPRTNWPSRSVTTASTSTYRH
jgi:hypothetical protein